MWIDFYPLLQNTLLYNSQDGREKLSTQYYSFMSLFPVSHAQTLHICMCIDYECLFVPTVPYRGKFFNALIYTHNTVIIELLMEIDQPIIGVNF
jgi:hypothetical protein